MLTYYSLVLDLELLSLSFLFLEGVFVSVTSFFS